MDVPRLLADAQPQRRPGLLSPFPFLTGAAPADSAARSRMVMRWHRANGVRLVAIAAARLTL